MTRRMLLFGGEGQLGQELRTRWAARDLELVTPSRAICDVSDPDAVGRVMETAAPDVVINAASYTNVDAAESQPRQAYLANAHGAEVVAGHCGRRDIPLIHVSTDFVFDGRKSSPYREGDTVSPINVYGASKAQGEVAVRRLAERHLIVRTAWLFGPYRSNFMLRILQLARERDELVVVDDQIGSPTSTHDLARALLAAADQARGDAAPWGTYHFAGGDSASRYEFAAEIVAAQAERTGHRPILKRIKTSDYNATAPRPADSRLDSGLFTSTFGVEVRPWRLQCREVVSTIMP